jgi:hypothetical protein
VCVYIHDQGDSKQEDQGDGNIDRTDVFFTGKETSMTTDRTSVPVGTVTVVSVTCVRHVDGWGVGLFIINGENESYRQNL